MANPPVPAARLAAVYAARLVSDSSLSTCRALNAKLGIPENTMRGYLKGLNEENLITALTRMCGDQNEPPSIDEHIEIARLKRELREAKSRADDLAIELGTARNFREDVLSIKSDPLVPRPIPIKTARKHGMTWVICLSDNHLGKKINREEISGLQDYNVEIAVNRIRRTFQKSMELIDLHGFPVESVLVMCLGDNTNGALRLDDDRNNEIPPIQQAKMFAGAVRDGIDALLNRYKCGIDVVFLPGNHGRTTSNPPSVEIGENYDCIAGMLVEWHFSGNKRVHVSNTGLADALIRIYGRGYLFTHGDRIGSGGGDGQIGALGPTKRGSLKIGQQEIELGKYISDRPDLAAVIMGHYHYHWTDYDVYVSGAACGPDQWSFLKLRVKPKPPYQWLLGIEAEKGIIEEKRLFVGHPDEGPICSFRRSNG